MSRIAAVILLFALSACGGETSESNLLAADANSAHAVTNNGETRVGSATFGGVELSSKNGEGASLTVTCSTGQPSVYVDTLRPVDRPPPLHGAFGHFTIDGKAQPATEMGWLPESSWSAHDRNPVRPLAQKLVAARSVKFVPPNGGSPVEWIMSVGSADRTKIVGACA